MKHQLLVTSVAAWTLAGCVTGRAEPTRVPLAATNVRCPAPSPPASTNLDPGLPTPGTVYDLTVPKGLRRLKHDPALLCQHVEFTDRSPLNVVIFATGWGDGVYPLALGYDEKDRVAAVVTYTYVVPWRLSGLPGLPPPPVLEREAKRAE